MQNDDRSAGETSDDVDSALLLIGALQSSFLRKYYLILQEQNV